MFSASSKIVKAGGAKLSGIEEEVTRALFDLQSNNNELKADVAMIMISGAKELDVANGKKAIVISVPYRYMKAVRKIHASLVQELEKKFGGRHVLFVADRRILPRQTQKNRSKQQKRPISRTLSQVHNAVLEDLVYPVEIVGKRTRFHQDGTRLIKVLLDPKEQAGYEYKAGTFASVYKHITGKSSVFEFPVQQ